MEPGAFQLLLVYEQLRLPNAGEPTANASTPYPGDDKDIHRVALDGIELAVL